ncbi:pleckstrin homology domain-containing family S member 1 [Ascaphus truei]|uniref:pleckstrin homology domain-containing family S member 1 n=1 Tax=Ascaphus truei TaxID=8439 RepID=UPI003F59CC8B
MLKYRRSSNAESCGTQTVIKTGYLIKSPPSNNSYVFNKRSSWKRRHFVLCKSSGDMYKLMYYTDENMKEEPKGILNFNEITGIEKGLNNNDKSGIIQKICNCSPQNVFCINTKAREYFFVAENEAEIHDWYMSISETWQRSKQKQSPEQGDVKDEEEVKRPFNISYPTNRPDIVMTLDKVKAVEEMIRPNSYPTNHPTSGIQMTDGCERMRSHTDPNKPICYHQCSNPRMESYPPSSTFLQDSQVKSNVECNEENFPQPDYDSDIGSDDDVYDVPSSLPVAMYQQFSDSTESSDPQETSDIEDDDGETYEVMGPIPIVVNTASTTSTCHRQPSKKHKPRVSSDLIRRQGSKLSRVFMSKMIYEQSGATSLVTLDIIVPKEHLKKYLILVQVGDRLCVCKWKGPKEIGCLFHHVDQIEAINDLKPESCEDVEHLLNKSTKDEVRLTVLRDPNAGVFHVEGCTCDVS